ncbi:MAG: CDP-alcohol phosphatidyltransferase family protein [Theionarchaea archaeon]|nr:CDP-alcohol phosphatidyltransferase family protein [Theionarchaea archaeon]
MNRRQWYETHTLTIGKLLARTGLTPNQLTLLSLVPAFISGYFYSQNSEVLGALFLCLTLLFDVFDGSVARALDEKTTFGAVMDPVIDRYCEFIVLLGILLGGRVDGWIVFLCFSGMIMASYTRARIETQGISALSVGLMERMEKTTIILAGSFLLPLSPDSLTIALLVVGILSHVTSAQRLVYARRDLK